MEEATPDTLSQEAAARLLDWTLDTYVLPEIGRRQADGRLPDPFRIWKARVVFDLDKPDEIRLNDEVRGVGKVRAARSIEVGREITLDDISEWGRFELTDADPNAAHITLLPNPTGDWALMFDWQYNTALVRKHIAAAREFSDQANDALEADRLIAFPEAAFAAAELLAKSELLTLPDRAFRDAKRHGAIRARYNEWAHSGNTEQRFADLLNQLDAQRAPSRYLRRSGEPVACQSRGMDADPSGHVWPRSRVLVGSRSRSAARISIIELSSRGGHQGRSAGCPRIRVEGCTWLGNEIKPINAAAAWSRRLRRYCWSQNVQLPRSARSPASAPNRRGAILNRRIGPGILAMGAGRPADEHGEGIPG